MICKNPPLLQRGKAKKKILSQSLSLIRPTELPPLSAPYNFEHSVKWAYAIRPYK